MGAFLVTYGFAPPSHDDEIHASSPESPTHIGFKRIVKMEIPLKSIVIERALSADLSDLALSPILSALAGTPAARSKILATSRDHTSCVMVWECTAGRFNWNYCVDETVKS